MTLILILVIAVLIPLLLVLGYRWAQNDLADERAELATQREVLQSEWQTLDNTRRVRAVFMAARRQMQAESERGDDR